MSTHLGSCAFCQPQAKRPCLLPWVFLASDPARYVGIALTRLPCNEELFLASWVLNLLNLVALQAPRFAMFKACVIVAALLVLSVVSVGGWLSIFRGLLLTPEH